MHDANAKTQNNTHAAHAHANTHKQVNKQSERLLQLQWCR